MITFTRSLGLSALLFGLSLAPASANAETTWKVAAGRSTIGFSVKHLVLMNVQGRFREYDGVVVTPDESDFAHAQVDVKIPVESIYTGNSDRDEHLKKSEFFNADKYPHIQFKSTNVVAKGGDEFEMRGMLTIRGVSRPVTLKVEETEAKTLPNGTKRLAFVASTSVNRYDFGLRWNELTEAGGMVVDENVKISLEVSLVEAPSVHASR